MLARQQGVLATVGDDEDPTYVVAADDAFGDVYDLTMIEGDEQPGRGEVVVSADTADDARPHGRLDARAGLPRRRPVAGQVAGIIEDTQVAGPSTSASTCSSRPACAASTPR